MDESSQSLSECAGCQNELQGKYFTWGSKSLPFCRQCIAEQFCLKCELPAFYVRERETHVECARCSSVLPECPCCGQTRGVQWWTIGPFTLCGKCGPKARNFGLCLGCGQPASRDRHSWCSACDSLPVMASQKDRVEELLSEVTDFLEEQFGIAVRDYCRLTVVTRKQFKKKGWNAVGLFTRQGDKRDIFLEEGLPEPLFLGTLAHEATHAWQHEKCPRQSELLCEGFATWIEYKVLQSCDVLHPDEWFEESLPPFYQEAFRAALRCEARFSALGFLQAVKGWSDFPR